MISIRIQGGLGNQLFMVFATLAYGMQHNVKVVFPYDYQVGQRHTYWETLLDSMKMFTTANPENGVTNDNILWLPIYQEPEFLYRTIPTFGENMCMIGYFQSYKYFESVQNTIFTMMKLEEKQLAIANKYDFFSDITIAMHFRMGDYKSKRYYHPVMNYEYFEASLDHIMERIKEKEKVRVLYFCEKEDNEYVGLQIARMHKKYPVDFVKVDDSIEDYNQLLIMSLCDHHIISNSSFSWWGAYLCRKTDAQTVCYPSKWFGEYYEHTHDHKNMMPDSWSKIVSNPIPWDEPL